MCRVALRAAAAAAMMLTASPAMAAACRATDFTDRPLSSLNEVQRLSLVTEMTRVEYERLKSAPQGSPNFYKLVADNGGITEARQAAHAKLASLNIENIDGYRKVWASDFLTDEGLQRFLNCSSSRQPGLALAGRSESPSVFHLTFTHITPIGIEKITTKLVATYNVANVAELEAFLAAIGPQDNYTAKTIPLRIIDPAKRAVVVMRAGWETPAFLYIPVYPAPDYFK